MWNVFDEWGLSLHLPRIDNEEISTYRERLLDVVRHRAGPQHIKLFYGINRDLGLTVYHDALILLSARKGDGLPIADDLTVEVRASGLHVSTGALRVIRESGLAPTDTLRIKLAKKAVSRDMIVEYPLGTRLSPDDYKFDWDRNELVFFKEEYAGATVYTSYLYYEVVETYGRTLQQVVTDLNAATTPGGDALVVASLKNGVSGSLSAEGLPLSPTTFIDDLHVTPTGEYYDMLFMPCGQANIRALNDEEFIDTLMGSGDVYFNTVLLRYIDTVKNLTHFGWESLVFDETRISDNQAVAVVPTLSDPKTTLWQSSDPTDTDTFSTYEAQGRDYLTASGDVLHRSGFASVEMQSGVGGKNDLKVVVEEGDKVLEFAPTPYDFYSTPTGDPTYTGDELQSLQEGF